MKFCEKCGTKLDDTSMFCTTCGATQEAPQQQAYQAPQQPIYQQPVYQEPQQPVYQQPQPAYQQPTQPEPQPQPTYQASSSSEQQPIYQTVYQTTAPLTQLKTNRSLVKFILLSLVTFGIYDIVCMSNISTDINVIASRYDGKKTTHFCLAFLLLAPITFGIYGLIWYHGLSSRIGNELKRRGIPYSFGASDFWLWNTLGCLIGVGPLIYTYKLLKAMNMLSQDFNIKG